MNQLDSTSPGPVLNDEALETLRSVGGDELVNSVVELFLSDSPGYLAAVGEALGAGDADGVARNAHSLKGSSGYVGAEAVAETCRRLEAGARSGDLAEAPRLVAELEAGFERTIGALRALSAQA